MTTCDCTGPAWPVMKELSVGGTSRWFVCPQCGTIGETRWHEDYSTLSKTVQQQAEAALRPQWIQPPLFDLNACTVRKNR